MQTRKEFILKITRIASFTLLASTTGYLLFREETEEKCKLDFVCGNCNKVEKCNIKEGVNHRQKESLQKKR